MKLHKKLAIKLEAAKTNRERLAYLASQPGNSEIARQKYQEYLKIVENIIAELEDLQDG